MIELTEAELAEIEERSGTAENSTWSLQQMEDINRLLAHIRAASAPQPGEVGELVARLLKRTAIGINGTSYLDLGIPDKDCQEAAAMLQRLAARSADGAAGNEDIRIMATAALGARDIDEAREWLRRIVSIAAAPSAEVER